MDKIHMIVVANSTVQDLANIIDEPVEKTLGRCYSAEIMVQNPQDILKDEDIRKFSDFFGCTFEIISKKAARKQQSKKNLKEHFAKEVQKSKAMDAKRLEEWLAANPAARIYKSSS